MTGISQLQLSIMEDQSLYGAAWALMVWATCVLLMAPWTTTSTLTLILKSLLAKSVCDMGLSCKYIFTPDNDLKHRILDTRLWLLYNTPHCMQTSLQSPDIHLIGNLWHNLEGIRNHKIWNKKDLRKALGEEWRQVTRETTEQLVKCIPKRLQEIMKRKEGPTRY